MHILMDSWFIAVDVQAVPDSYVRLFKYNEHQLLINAKR